MNVWIWTLVTLGIGYLANAFRMIEPNEMAVRVLLGIPLRVEKFGLIFIVWPLEKLVIYPTKAVRFEFPDFEVITSAGKYDSRHYEKLTVTIKRPTLCFQWPNDKNLLQTYKNLPEPREVEKLQKEFEDIVVNTLRSHYSVFTWRQISKSPQTVYSDVLAALRESGDMTNPFFRGRVKPLEVSVKEVSLPPEITEAINRPEAARSRAEETVVIAKGEAAARRVLFNAIRQGDLPKEALLTLREMAKGKGTTFAMLPPEILQVFQGVLGQQTTPDELSKWFLGLLSEPDFREKLQKLLKKRLDEDSGEP